MHACDGPRRFPCDLSRSMQDSHVKIPRSKRKDIMHFNGCCSQWPGQECSASLLTGWGRCERGIRLIPSQCRERQRAPCAAEGKNKRQVRMAGAVRDLFCWGEPGPGHEWDCPSTIEVGSRSVCGRAGRSCAVGARNDDPRAWGQELQNRLASSTGFHQTF